MLGNSGNTYSERIKTVKNDGEYLFEMYCQTKGYKFHRIGFDEHENNVDKYWRLSDLLRNLPDFVVNAQDKTFVVAVKGTDKFKEKEFNLLPSMVDCFSSRESPLIYAFCFKENAEPIFVFPNQIIELYNNSVDEKWHDGVIHRNLKLRKKS